MLHLRRKRCAANVMAALLLTGILLIAHVRADCTDCSAYGGVRERSPCTGFLGGLGLARSNTNLPIVSIGAPLEGTLQGPAQGGGYVCNFPDPSGVGSASFSCCDPDNVYSRSAEESYGPGEWNADHSMYLCAGGAEGCPCPGNGLGPVPEPAPGNDDTTPQETNLQ